MRVAAQGSLFAGRPAARLFQSLIRYLTRPPRTSSEDASAFVRPMSRNFFPAAQRCVRRMKEALGMRPSDDRHRIAGARDPVAFAYPSDKRCAGRSDGALRQPFSPLSSRCSGAKLRPVWPENSAAQTTPLSRCACRMRYEGQQRKRPQGEPCGGLLVDEDAQSIRTFYILQKPLIFYTKSKTFLSF